MLDLDLLDLSRQRRLQRVRSRAYDCSNTQMDPGRLVAESVRKCVRIAFHYLRVKRECPGAIGDGLRGCSARPVLTPDLVRHIRAAHASGTSAVAIAQGLGLNRSTVGNVIQGLTWKHLV